VFVDIDIISPFFSSDCQFIKSQNFINLSPFILNVFKSVIKLYQSPLSSLPIKSGCLFSESPDSKPKLSRFFKQVQLNIDLRPVLAGLTHYMDHNSGVGLRLKAEHMLLDMVFEQRPFKKKKDEKAVQRVATKWCLEASEINFSQLEARSVLIDLNSVFENGLSDIDSWIMQSDLNNDKKAENVRMIPFAWTPKFIYYKRTEVLKEGASSHPNHTSSILFTY